MSSLIITPSLTALLFHSRFHKYICNVIFFFFKNDTDLCPVFVLYSSAQKFLSGARLVDGAGFR